MPMGAHGQQHTYVIMDSGRNSGFFEFLPGGVDTLLQSASATFQAVRTAAVLRECI